MRLIDADAIEYTHAIARSLDDGHNWNELCVTKDEIEDMPTVKPEPHSDRIEVGDEVIDKDGDMTIVTNIHERLFDGLCSDGSTMGDLFLEDVRKTGRHYDHISKLLEAIRA